MERVPKHVRPESVVGTNVYQPLGVEDGFHDAWLRERAGFPPGEVIWTTANGGHWLVTSGKVMQEIYADTRRFSSRSIFVPKERNQVGLLPNTLDPPEHRPFRNLLNSGFSPKAVAHIKPLISAYAKSVAAELRPRGSCDFVNEFALLLPIDIFLSVSGLSTDDRPRLRQLAESVTRADNSVSMHDIKQGFADYINPIIEERRVRPGEDFISSVVVAEVNGQRLENAEIVEIVMLVLIGSLDSVASLMSFAMLYLAKNPARRRELIDDPNLMQDAVEEFVRRYPLVTTARYVVEDYAFHGVELKAGDLIAQPTVLHGLDDRENEEALCINFKRAATSHSTFGGGPHKCPGAYLAQVEIGIGLQEWLSEIPDFALDASKPISFKGGVVGTIESLPLRWS